MLWCPACGWYVLSASLYYVLICTLGWQGNFRHCDGINPDFGYHDMARRRGACPQEENWFMRNLRATALVLALLLTTVLGNLAPATALAQSSDTTNTPPGQINVVRKVLDNGLEVLVVPRPGTGVAIADVWVGVGSIDETPKNNGVAHFFEHMVFKGTPTRPVGSIDLAVDSMGGSNNAATSYDWTHYYIEAPSPKIDEALGILADMTYNAAFPQEEIEREKAGRAARTRYGRERPTVVSL